VSKSDCSALQKQWLEQLIMDKLICYATSVADFSMSLHHTRQNYFREQPYDGPKQRFFTIALCRKLGSGEEVEAKCWSAQHTLNRTCVFALKR
jgi:hypothetical protein